MTIKYLLVLCTVASLAVGCEKVNRTEDSGAEVAPLVPIELTLAEQKVRDASTKEEVGAYYEKMVKGLVEADRNVQFTSANSFCWAPYRNKLV